MGISLKVTIYLLTASVSLLSVKGNKGGLLNIPCDQTPVTQKAHDGGSVTIDCKYPRAEESNIKYFCRGDEKAHCTHLISSHTSKYTKKDRFSLTDDRQRGVYTVTISTLTPGDARIYWCAMKRFDARSIKCLTEIHLEILNWDDITPTLKTCDTGDTVRIDCQYPDSHETNEKFLCKGENPFYCEKLISTTEEDRDVVEGRFYIRDNKRLKYFYMNINHLSTADSGTYWCGSDRTWQHAKQTKVVLSVAERHAKTKRPSPSSSQAKATAAPTFEKMTPENNDASEGLIAGVVVSVALSLTLVVVLILCRHKFTRTQGCCAAGGSSEQGTNAGHNTEGNHGDHDYEEIQMRNQQASSGDVLSSIYAVVNPPADQLHYSSFNFQKDSVCVSTDGNALPDTNKNGSSTCDYSSISRAQGTTHPPAAEQTLYSTVTKPGEP